MHERLTDIVAAGALISPVWLPSLHEWSEMAGLLVPILGGLWLVIQIVVKLDQWRRDRRR